MRHTTTISDNTVFKLFAMAVALAAIGCSAELASDKDNRVAEGPISSEAEPSVSGQTEELTAPDCASCPRICSVLPSRVRSFCLQSCQERCVSKCEVCKRNCLSEPAGTLRNRCLADCDRSSACKGTCGNGRVEGKEECDDGNRVDTDACNNLCVARRAVCGNGVLESTEICDDGNTVAGDGCSPVCLNEPVCGNGKLESGESCDDGNTVAGDGCSPVCQTEPVCGNGKLESGEGCDDGNTVAGDGCSSTCVPERCGDGVVQMNELCDDGNTTSGDGCSSTCQPERTCKQCIDAKCRNNPDYGVDLYAGCFEKVNSVFGADSADPSFVQDCMDLVSCAAANNCAYGANGLAPCYCGSATADDCVATGPAADAKCLAQVQKATRTTNNTDVVIRISDLAYPAGWAYFLLECETAYCNNATDGKCTP